MAGRLEVWGKSLATFDRLHRSSLPLTVSTGKSLAKINATFLEIYNLNETIAKYAAQTAGFPYGEGFENEDPALLPVKTILKTIDGPRGLMSRDEVNFYRSQLKTMTKSMNSNLAEIQKLAGTTRKTLETLNRIERFYRFTEAQEQAARRKTQQSTGGVKRAGKTRRRKK